MLVRLISSVRKKPKHVRDQYAFWIAAGFTALIATPIIFGMPGRLDPASTNADEAESEPLFSSFLDEVSGRFSEATEPINDLRETIEAPEADAPVATATTSSESVASSTDREVAPQAERKIRIATTSASATP